MYCAGTFQCLTGNIFLLYLIKLVYIFFWTFVLQLICKKVTPVLSWVLVLGPYLLMLLFILSFIFFSAQDIPSKSSIWYT